MKGIYFRKDRGASRLCWRARVRHQGTEINKLFETKEEAYEWYLKTKEELTREERKRADAERERNRKETRAKKEAERERKRLEREAKRRHREEENAKKKRAKTEAKAKKRAEQEKEREKKRTEREANKLTDEERRKRVRISREKRRRAKGIKPAVRLTDDERAQKRKEYDRLKYEKMSREQRRAREHKRRAREKNAVPSWAKHVVGFEANLRTSIKAIAKITELVYNIDHIVPLSASLKTPSGVVQVACGLHCEDNLQILEQELNLAKNCYFWDDMWEYDDQSAAEVYELYERINTDLYLENAT